VAARQWHHNRAVVGDHLKPVECGFEPRSEGVEVARLRTGTRPMRAVAPTVYPLGTHPADLPGRRGTHTTPDRVTAGDVPGQEELAFGDRIPGPADRVGDDMPPVAYH